MKGAGLWGRKEEAAAATRAGSRTEARRGRQRALYGTREGQRPADKVGADCRVRPGEWGGYGPHGGQEGASGKAAHCRGGMEPETSPYSLDRVVPR